MLFTSFQFLWLFPIVFAVVWFIPAIFEHYGLTTRWKGVRLQNGLLLAVSYLLYFQIVPAYTLILLFITLVTYAGALLCERPAFEASARRRKALCYATVITALSPLLLFKYYNFVNTAVHDLMASLGLYYSVVGLNWIVPLGISFFTFQALGYFWDVYRRTFPAERNWWDYMLFVSFFPQIASGPISSASELLPQIKGERRFDPAKATIGCRQFLWGIFLKVCVADRLGLYVDTVYKDFLAQSGITCFAAMFAYSLQIFADFAGYSLMAIGIGRILGFDLINNFNRPYFAASVTEFWKRWHISLTRWLTKYVYIPLGGSRCSKARCYKNIMVTFLVSGIWHGANWNFIMWGGIHGVAQIAEKHMGWQKRPSRRLALLLRTLLTFVVVSVAWVFFRMPTIGDSVSFFRHAFGNITNLQLFTLQMDKSVYLLTALAIMLVAEFLEEFGYARFSPINHSRRSIRWAGYLTLILLVATIGILDSSNFIYFNF